jgi:Na+/H+ antiporter NhaD/arsenite permease-like protein
MTLFFLFALTLLGIALFHRYSLGIALGGLIVIMVYKLWVTGFPHGPGVPGLLAHLEHEWVILANLFGLIVGFGVLAQHFERTRIPQLLPRLLPDHWTGGFVLLSIIFILSSFLDNIAAAMIGGTVALAVYRGKVHVGYLAAIVAASNAGGAGSVLGDTTTTMMWIAGVPASEVLHAYVAAVPALLLFGVTASKLQQRYSPIVKDTPADLRVDWAHIGIVTAALITVVAVNIATNTVGAQYQIAERFPVLAAALWMVLFLAVFVRVPDWKILPDLSKSAVFLLALVLCASMMPVEKLPPASWESTFVLGFVSSVFDNIPLTKLALDQGGYDWGLLAYAVGFGGSMIWFGSSAGVALSSRFPQARSVIEWLRSGWPVIVAYLGGYFILLGLLGWQPHSVG